MPLRRYSDPDRVAAVCMPGDHDNVHCGLVFSFDPPPLHRRLRGQRMLEMRNQEKEPGGRRVVEMRRAIDLRLEERGGGRRMVEMQRAAGLRLEERH
jgi:hypothetical protein